MLTLAEMERLIRVYFDGCNEADTAKMTACFTSDAVHYFPPGMYGGPFVGSHTIAERWVAAVRDLGSQWSVDTFVGDADTGVAVIEWTHVKWKQGKVLRGDEWYRFDLESGLIREIRAYYASPQSTDLQVCQLEGFDYEGCGYPAVPADLSASER